MPTAYMAEPFGVVAPFLADYGYHPVPIKPGFKAPLLDDWQTPKGIGHYLPRCARWGTGILTATCPAVDLDIRDKELVRVLIRLGAEMLGPTPFRVGAPPKALLPFSTAAPFDKISGRWFALPGENWRAESYAPHRLEVLGNGQQFVAYARHPRGTFYRWRRGEPMDTSLIDLPEIDQASANVFLWSAQRVIRHVGAVALQRIDKEWFPAPWEPADFGEPEQKSVTRLHRDLGGGTISRDWQALEPEDLAKRIDAKHARRLKDGGWICSCPAHTSEGHRSLSITPRDGGGSVVHCFGGCTFLEVAREISNIVGSRAAA
jgi:Bifunctional DNA primase/polymerase, N-terminal